jgi:hypothetical protein
MEQVTAELLAEILAEIGMFLANNDISSAVSLLDRTKVVLTKHIERGAKLIALKELALAIRQAEVERKPK